MPTKKCPFCAEEIQEEALVCKHCHKDFAKEKLKKANAKGVVGCLVFLLITFTFIGCWLVASCNSSTPQAEVLTPPQQQQPTTDYLSDCEGVNVGAELMVINPENDSPILVLKSIPKSEPGGKLKLDTDHLAHGTLVTVAEINKTLARVRVDKTKKLFWLPCENLGFRKN